MNYRLLLFGIGMCLSLKIHAQTGAAINASGADPEGSAMLDVSSTTMGLLIPRMTRTERDAIVSPSEGLMIFQTNETTGFYYYQTTWKFVGNGLDYSLLSNKPGNATTTTDGFLSEADKTKLDATATGTVPGQMQYWNGSAWLPVTVGLNGQVLKYIKGVPTWVDGNIRNLSIGDHYQGGFIVYFLVPGDPGYDANIPHGLIASPYDNSSAIQWGPIVTVSAFGLGIGDGPAATRKIVDSLGPGDYAAYLCDTLTLNGHSDWYLPSRDELRQLYYNRDLIGGVVYEGIYWTSLESNSSFAYNTYFTTLLNEYAMPKSTLRRVRAFRSF